MTLEEIRKLSIEDVEKRMNEIRSIDLEKAENIEELTKEVDALTERRNALKEDASAKKELRAKIANGAVQTTVIEKPKENRTMTLTKENYRASDEYRSAFLNNLMGRQLNEEQRAAFALAGVDPVIPESMQTSIITKVKEYAPILSEITLLNVNGTVKFAVEGTVAGADLHTENAEITAATDTLVEVTLSTYEVTKLVQISDSVRTMTINAFESWLVDNLSESIALKIEYLIWNGTGSSQAKGINAITFDAAHKVEVAKSASLTAQNVFDLFGKLKTGYARNAKIYMNRKTLFSDFLPLVDKSKNDLVVATGGTYYVLGTPVELTDSIADHEAIMFDPKKYVANMPENTNIKQSVDLRHNAYLYLGVAQFDGKPALEEAFVKLVKLNS